MSRKRRHNSKRKMLAVEQFSGPLLAIRRARVRRFERLEDRRLLSTTPYATIADNLNTQLSTLQSQLTTVLDALHTGTTALVPFVGSQVGDAAKVINQFETTLHNAIHNLGTISDPNGTQLVNAINTALAQGNSSGVVVVAAAFSQPGTLGANGFELDLRLDAVETVASTPINFNTGLPSLPFKVTANGSLDVQVGFDMELAFTYNSNTQSVGLDDTKTLSGVSTAASGHSLAIYVSAGIPSTFNATATIGFVEGSLTPIPLSSNALTLTVLVDRIASQPTVSFTGSADANLTLHGSFAGTDGDFPGINTDVHLHWGIDSSNASGNEPTVSFDNVSLDLGKFLSNVVGPVLTDIHYFTDPLAPVLDVLEYPLPGLTQLDQLIGGNKIDLLDLAKVAATVLGFGPLAEIAKDALDITNQINQIDVGPTVTMPLGGFELDDQNLIDDNIAGDISNLDLSDLTDISLDPTDLTGLALAASQEINSTIDSLNIDPQAKALLHQLAAPLDNGVEISFPVFENPAQSVFNLLLGKDSDLFSMDADVNFDAQGSVATGLSIFGMGIDFGGDVNISAHFKFGYDTYGLRELVNQLATGDSSHIASDITDGFYLSDDSFFKMNGGVFAGVESSVGIFGATLGGFVSTGDSGNDPVSVTIDDPNHDGKLRFQEIEDHPFGQPGTAITASGEFTGELGLEVRAGVEAFGHFYGWRKRFDVAQDVIIDFDNPNSSEHPGKQDSDYTLATNPDSNGNINLYIGTLASKRSGLFVNDSDGDTTMLIQHVSSDQPSGTETIKISLLQHTPIGGQDYWVSETIAGVKSITGIANQGNFDIEVQPGVTSNVDLEGGVGIATIDYYGTGTAYLKAGDEDSNLVVDAATSSTLIGGPGNDTIQLGSGGTSVTGGGGANTVIITTPLTQGGTIVGGDDPGNAVVIVAGENTQSISATPGDPGTIDLNYQIFGQPPGAQLVLSMFSTLVATAQDSATDIVIGDLSAAGINLVIVNEPTIVESQSQAGREIDLDPRAGLGPSQLALDPFVHTYTDGFDPNQTITDPTGLELQNFTTGVTTYLLGVEGNDVTTIHQHGGSLTVGQLSNNDGTIVFDGSQRQTGQNDVVTMTTPVIALGNTITTGPDQSNNFVVKAENYPTFVFVGMLAIDSMIMNLAAPGMISGINTANIDASTLAGSFTVNAEGDSTAKNSVTISKLNSRGKITVQGGTSSSSVFFGTGRLADIQGNVDVHNAVLTIDNSTAHGTAANSTAPGGSIFTMNSSAFVGWDIPGFVGTNPSLTYTGLYGQLTVNGGEADQFDMESTPSTVSSAVFNNASDMRDTLYFVTWDADTTTNGDFAIYLGQRLHTDGTVERLKHLTGVANVSFVVNLKHPIDDGTNFVFDGDLDPAGALYTIDGGPDGGGKLHIENMTENLGVLIENYRAQDQAYIYLPGGTVTADLTKTSAGTITIDGQARLAGINPNAPNTISASVAAGVISLNPTGTFDSVLQDRNTVNILGAKPQDTLSVIAPTTTAIAPTSLGTPNTELDLQDAFSFFDPYTVANPPLGEFYIVTGAQYTINSGPAPRPGLLNDSLLNSLGVVFFDTTLVYQNTNHLDSQGKPITATVSVREFPISSDPQAIDNAVSLDASQLRGVFNFNVSEPDYAGAAQIDNSDFINGFDQEVDDNLPVTSYGQTHVTLSKVNPELSVSISGTSQISQANYNGTENGLETLNIQPNPPFVNFAATDVTIGSGVMANIQGNVAVHQVWLKDVDDRQGTSANSLTLASTTYTGWTTVAGTHPTLSMDTLDGELTLSGSGPDQFDVEDTPNTALKTTIRNFTTDGIAPGVYVMGKSTAPLYIDGHFSVYAGRRLNADGSVTNVGKVDNLYNLADKFVITGGTFSTVYSGTFLFDDQLLGSKTLNGLVNIVPGLAIANWLLNQAPFALDLPLFDSYVGAIQGTLVFDTSNDVIQGSDFNDGLESNPNYPGQGDLRYRTLGDIVYGPNLEVFDYGPQLTGNSPPSVNKLGSTVILNNPQASLFHYISNPNSVNAWEQIEVGATTGPVSVVGRDSFTRVELDPTYSNAASTLFDAASGGLPGWGNVTGSSNLLTTIQGDVTVSHAGLTIHANVSGSAAPATVPQVVVTDTQITGIAGATIHYSNLSDGYELITETGSLIQVSQFPGLMIRMPTYGIASVQIQNTPGGATTELDTLTNAIGNVTVQGTTGTLSLGDLSSFAHDEFYNFAAASVNIGGGTLLGLKGNVDFGASYAVPLTTIDDRNDNTAPQMTLQDLSNITLGGASTGSIVFQSNVPSTSQFNIYGAANAHWTMNDSQPNTQLYANTGSQFSVTRGKNSSIFPPITILGAQSISLDGQNGVGFNSSAHFKVEADPARPTDVTNLTVDLSNTFQDNLKLDAAGGGFFSFFTNNATLQPITYEGDTTRLTYITDFPALNDRTVTVANTGSAGTVISAGRIALNVLATGGPLEVDQGNGGPITLGNSGNLQGIHGTVTFFATNAALPSLPVTIDDSADSTITTVSISPTGPGNSQVSGLTSSPVQLTGSSLITLTLKGGTGNNKLVGSDTANAWDITAANGGTLDQTTSFSHFGNLQGGSQSDNFFFKPAGSLSGNLDGGPGTDTVYYQAGMLTGSDVIDLPDHIVPRVTGQALNLESSDSSFSPLTLTNPGPQSIQVNTPVNLSLTSTGGFGTKTFSATGLPPGVTINPSTGVISGTNTTDSYSATIAVTVTDDTGSVSTTFSWTTLAGLVLTPQLTQSVQVSQVITLPIPTSYSYGGTLTYSVSTLPAGLSINSHTGTISGTVADGAQLSSPYFTTVTASDGTHSTTTSFEWIVAKSLTILNPGTQLTPDDFVVNLQIQVINAAGPVTYSASNLPSFLQIDPNTGLISGTLADYSRFGTDFSFNVQISANDTVHTVTAHFTWNTEPGFTPEGIFDRSNRSGDVVDTSVGAVNREGVITVASVTGLPTGLTFDPSTGDISGTIDNDAFTGSPYHTTVTYDNQTYNYTYSVDFNWTVTPSIVIQNPDDQTSAVGSAIDLPIVVTRSFGQPVTFSASSLPLGLTIDPTTGVISGSVGAQLSSSSDFFVDIHATDGTVDGDVTFNWHVGQAAANVAQLFDPITGGTLTLTSPEATTLTAQILDGEEGSDYPLGLFTFTVDGVAPGGAANVVVHSSVLVNSTGYYIDSPTPADSDYHWFDFAYQRQTDADDASTTGAEFLSDGDIVLHLVDGARGDSDLTADRQINVYYGGLSAIGLNASVVGGPGNWLPGVPLTVTSEISGSAAPGATLLWQAYYYTPDFENLYNLPNGTNATYTFIPPQSGYYYVTLTATSADGTVTVENFDYSLFVPDTTAGTPPIGGFAIAGIPSDILAGHSITASILADDADGNPLAGYTGPISVQISDPQNNTIYSTSGNFGPSQFTLGPVTLNNTGTLPVTDTITITAGTTTESLPIVVHPVSQFVGTENSLTVAEQTPFDISFAAEDDRGVFDSDYAGSAKLTYVDNQGEHDLSGGFQAVSGGVVTFQDIVLPSRGVYQLLATSADGNVVGNFYVDSQGIELSALVMNIADSGAGSLRQAMLDAAADTSGQQFTIQFALPAGPQTINLQSPLPTPTDPLMLSLDATQDVTIVGSSSTAWNNSQSFTLSGVGSLRFVGGIDGTGNLIVDAGGNLTADSIVQNTLSIGAGATVTIAPSGSPISDSTVASAASTTDASATSSLSQAVAARLAVVRARRLAALLLAESSVSTGIATASIEAASTTVAETSDATTAAPTIAPSASILPSTTPVVTSAPATPAQTAIVQATSAPVTSLPAMIIPATSVSAGNVPATSVQAMAVEAMIIPTNDGLSMAVVSNSGSGEIIASAPPLPQRQSSRSDVGQSVFLPAQIVFDQSFHPAPSDLNSNLLIGASNWRNVSSSPMDSSSSLSTSFVGKNLVSNGDPRSRNGVGILDQNSIREVIDAIFATDTEVASRFDDFLWALSTDDASNSN